MYSTALEVAPEDDLPRPAGYKVLIAMPKLEEKTAGGIYIPTDLKKREEVASIFGKVLRLGPDAYADKDRFQSGPLCKVGDWVMINPYAGVRFTIGDQEYRFINDDTVEATVDDPKNIARGF